MKTIAMLALTTAVALGAISTTSLLTATSAAALKIKVCVPIPPVVVCT
jgi:hypothetical protein